MKLTDEEWERLKPDVLRYLDNLDNTKIRRIPELPKVQLKRKKTIYTVPDLRLLRPSGQNMIEDIFNKIVSGDTTISDGEETVSYAVPHNFDDERLEIVNDIVTGFSYKSEYKDGSIVSSPLIYGFSIEESDNNGGRIVTYYVYKEFADFIRIKALRNGDGEIDLITTVMDFADERYKQMRKGMKQ